MESKASASDTALLPRVLEYFYEDESFADYFEDWCRERAHAIDLRTEENKLQYTDMYKDYLRDFEDKITEFIQSCGATIEDLYEELKENPPDSEEDVFVQILSASTDYDVFIQMMREAAEQLGPAEAKASTEAKS